MHGHALESDSYLYEEPELFQRFRLFASSVAILFFHLVPQGLELALKIGNSRAQLEYDIDAFLINSERLMQADDFTESTKVFRGDADFAVDNDGGVKTEIGKIADDLYIDAEILANLT